jgi:cytochrome c553
MRERIAVGVSVLAAALLVSLSAVFARSQNPPGDAGGSGGAELAEVGGSGGAEPALPAVVHTLSADSVGGRAVFVANGCARCHSVAGEGNARNPLDGVGARRTLEELRAWTVGAEALADSLPPSAYRAKQAFQQVPEEELAQLIAYLSSLRQTARPE